MTLEQVLYTGKVRTTGSWKDIFMKHPLLRLVFVTLLAAQATPRTVWAQVQVAPPISGVIGKVQSFTAAHSTFRHLQEWSTLMSSSPSQPISRYRRISVMLRPR